MYVIFQGESLLVPAVVTGDKNAISNLVVELKASARGEVPLESADTVASFSVSDLTNDEITDGYLFTLTNTSTLAPGIYFMNYKFTTSGLVQKGIPKKVTIKASVV